MRLDRYRLALDPHKGNPRVVDTLLRISERYAKLLGLDAPQRIETSGPGAGPIQTQDEALDFSKLSLEEKLRLEQLMIKAGAPATKATETLPAMLRGAA
jgi:hypothetical protein